jgi:hypothetical protein
MDKFFVLGIVPGTNIQITFQLWLQIVAVFLGYIILCIVTVSVYRFFKYTNQLLIPVPVRTRMHATQLHQRVR